MNKKVGKKIIGIGVGTLTFFLSLGCAYFLTPNRVKKGNFVSIEKDEYEESHFMKFINTFAKDTGILPNHISKVLKELKEAEIVECINPEVRKGRLYRLTDVGDEIAKEL